MNKWQDPFEKNQQASCNCSSQGLFVPNRQLSLIVAGLLFLAFSIFMTGYFLGKKNVVEEFSEKMQQESFADQIYTSMLSTVQEQSADHTLLVTDADVTEIPLQTINQEMVTVEAQDCSQEAAPSIHYYAQLIGFGTEKAAQLFVKKLAAKGIETEIKKRASKSVKGRTSYWYQVVTPAYANKNDLLQLVDRITKEENIKDANIRIC